MSQQSLRTKLIRLAKQNPELREDLLPLIRKTSSQVAIPPLRTNTHILDFVDHFVDLAVKLAAIKLGADGTPEWISVNVPSFSGTGYSFYISDSTEDRNGYKILGYVMSPQGISISLLDGTNSLLSTKVIPFRDLFGKGSTPTKLASLIHQQIQF